MSLLKEYAVDPACLGVDARTAAQVLDLFGCERGRVIAGCPRAWLEEAKRALDWWPEDQRHTNKRATIVERLRKLKAGGLFPGRHAWPGGRPWPDAALAEHRLRPFSGVLATTHRDADNWIVVPDDLDPGDACLHAGHEIRVERTAPAMAQALTPLLQASKVILFVDPHFSPDRNSFLTTLRAWLNVVNRPTRLEYHLLGAGRDGETRFDGQWFQDKLQRRCRFVPAGMTLSFFQWRERAGGEHFHARYIITDRAAVRIDNGLDEGRPGQTAPLTLLPYSEHQRWFRAFGEAADVYELIAPIYDMSAGGYIEER